MTKLYHPKCIPGILEYDLIMDRQGTVGYLIQDQKVLLALIKYSPKQILWNGIGGFIEAGESPDHALIREYTEETGLIVSNLKAVSVIHLPKLILHVFIAYNSRGNAKPKDPSILELRWFSLNEIPYAEMHPSNQVWLEPILSKFIIQ